MSCIWYLFANNSDCIRRLFKMKASAKVTAPAPQVDSPVTAHCPAQKAKTPSILKNKTEGVEPTEAVFQLKKRVSWGFDEEEERNHPRYKLQKLQDKPNRKVELPRLKSPKTNPNRRHAWSECSFFTPYLKLLEFVIQNLGVPSRVYAWKIDRVLVSWI